jgi:hypothetical protein
MTNRRTIRHSPFAIRNSVFAHLHTFTQKGETKMKRNTWFNLLMVLGLVLALGGGIVMARRAQAQGPGPEGPLGPQAAVGTAFTYQGRLLDSDTPVDGTLDFHFTLWTAPSGGDLVAEQAASGVGVNDGYFSVPLDFGSDAFEGDARYLGIEVEGTSLEPRVTLTAAPYAHSLRPGAKVEGSDFYVLNVTNNGTGDGIRAYSSATAYNYAALWGLNDSTGSGVYGGNSGGGYGIYGYATASSGTTYGVYGRSDSGTGYGVYGYSSASNHGVHGKANPPDGYGIYSEGNAYVEGKLFWDAKTGYVSVPAAAFHPMAGGYSFQNNGYALQNVDGSSDFYLALVQLPHGAIVTNLTFYWNDGSWDYDGNCGLYRIDLAGNEVNMATTTTNGSAMTPDSSEDATIDYAPVGNSQYAYYVYWRLPDNAVLGYGAVIEYTFTEPY